MGVERVGCQVEIELIVVFVVDYVFGWMGDMEVDYLGVEYVVLCFGFDGDVGCVVSFFYCVFDWILCFEFYGKVGCGISL